MVKTKIEIKSRWLGGKVLFEYEDEDNSTKKALEKAVAEGADLEGAYLKGADLEGAYLEGADLEGAYLKGAYLRGVKNLPQWFINVCSRDLLFVFEHLKEELPFLREKIISGEVEGTQYEGECACLIGTFGKGDMAECKKVATKIPFYDIGLHNYGEQWFWNIRKGDTPENNSFAKHALELIDLVLKGD